MIRHACWLLALMFTASGLVVSCAGPTPTPTTIAKPANTRTRTPRPPTPTSRSKYTLKVNLDDFAPPGNGRDLLILNCSNCHTFACALLGQRTWEHWETVRMSHRDRLGINLPDEDYEEIFFYLKENFTDKQPQPELPPELVGKGCTTPYR